MGLVGREDSTGSLSVQEPTLLLSFGCPQLFFSPPSPKSPSLSHSLASLPPDPPKGRLFALALGVVPRGRGARPHQGGIRAGLSNCLRLKACLDTCRTSPSQACTSCFREAESAESRASTALVTWVKQRVRQYRTPA